MYIRSFGLRSDPFGMTPDPSCLFLTTQHREAFAGLAYAILNRRGFGVLTGDAGTGKTTLVAKVLASVPKDKVKTSIIFHPTLTTTDFFELVLLDFGIQDIPATKAQRLTCLQAFLLENYHQGKISTLIVDEAHKLSLKLLEEIRLLGNFTSADQKLLQILLVGQTELDDVLSLDSLRQLKQRIAIRLRIGSLAAGEIQSYIRYRWMRAGGNDTIPFTQDAIEEISRASRGLPRVINALCDNALLNAFAEQDRSVQLKHVRHAGADLQLFSPSTAAIHEPTGTTSADPAADLKTVDPVPHSIESHASNDVSASQSKNHTPSTPPLAIPSPLRVPDFAMKTNRPSLLARWAGKLVGNI